MHIKMLIQVRLRWVEPWQLIDMNDDGHIDIAGSRTADENYNNAPIVYFNDGKGRFEIGEIGSQTSVRESLMLIVILIMIKDGIYNL